MFKKMLLAVALMVMSGAAYAEEMVGVVAPMPGRYFRGSPQKDWPVTVIHVKVGDRVKAGDCLVELDPAKLPQQEAKAKLQAAKHHVMALKEKQKYKQKCFERWGRVAVTGAASQQEGDERREDLQALVCEINCAIAQQEAADVALAREKYDFDHYQRIPSLIAGRVTAINCDLGMVARAEEKQLDWVRVLDDSKVYIKCAVAATKALALRKSAKKTADIVGKKVVAKIVDIPNVIEKGNMEVVLEADNPNGELIVGDEIKVSF